MIPDMKESSEIGIAVSCGQITFLCHGAYRLEQALIISNR